MNPSEIYSQRNAARESVIIVWRSLGAAGFEVGDAPRYDTEWIEFSVRKAASEVVVEWRASRGLDVRFAAAPNEEMRQEISGLLQQLSLPIDRVL